jgi:outer membrane protein TolC
MQKSNTLRKLILTLFIMPGFLLGGTAIAQENLLTDVSYLYLEKLIASAKENYPKLKTFNSQVKTAKSDLATAKSGWLNPFSFQYVTRSNQASSNLVNLTTADFLNGYQFGVSVNPGELLARPSQVKKAKEMVKIAELNQEEYNLQLEAEVKKRYFVYLQAKASLASYIKTLIDVESTLKSVRIKYQKSEISLEDYNSASLTYNQTNIAKIQSESNYLVAKADLEELTVKKIEEIK